jgi:hypothetical protein
MREASAASLILDDFGGDERTRTADPLLAKQVLYQLSYVPADGILSTGSSGQRRRKRRPREPIRPIPAIPRRAGLSPSREGADGGRDQALSGQQAQCPHP